jgi:predicted P-loop ATPase
MAPVVNFAQPAALPTWLVPVYDNIPALMRQHPRWMLWTLNGEARKVPRAASSPHGKNINAHNPNYWCDFEKILGAKDLLNCPGFALGPVANGPTFAGIDLDDCRNPATGIIEDWAWAIIRAFDSYTEISPSGSGLKIFVTGALHEDDDSQRKVYQLELYDRKRYFTVTGHHLAGTPTTVEPREAQLRNLYHRQQSQDLVELCKLFGLYQRERGEWVDILCPWADEHPQATQVRDTALHVDDEGHVDGFECFHSDHKKKTLGDVLKLFSLTLRPSSDFVTDKQGRIVEKSQENIKRALAKMDVQLSYNLFSLKRFITQQGKTQPEALEDEHVIRLWLKTDTDFGFLPPKDFYFDVVNDLARQQSSHPVRMYLDKLQWDGAPRINTWLTNYGKAKDTAFTRAAGALVLMAAVRRVRQPGVKFDEMLTLISRIQGTNKSAAVQALCPFTTWFSDDLPLNVDAKQIIERTAGKWIIEAAELNGFGKQDREHLKAMLSRQVDGPARMAYGRMSVEVPRQFIIIGTTNTNQFLKDMTGARRIWPVEVRRFDVAGLIRDRDQLWAEAAHREACKESIRLDESLWSKAAREQENRQHDDPWEVLLDEYFNPTPAELPAVKLPADMFAQSQGATQAEPPSHDRFTLDVPWTVLGIPPERQTETQRDRIATVMQRLGFEKKTARGLGDDKKVAKRWCRIEHEPDEVPVGPEDEDDREPGADG